MADLVFLEEHAPLDAGVQPRVVEQHIVVGADLGIGRVALQQLVVTVVQQRTQPAAAGEQRLLEQHTVQALQQGIHGKLQHVGTALPRLREDLGAEEPLPQHVTAHPTPAVVDAALELDQLLGVGLGHQGLQQRAVIGNDTQVTGLTAHRTEHVVVVTFHRDERRRGTRQGDHAANVAPLIDAYLILDLTTEITERNYPMLYPRHIF